MKKDLSVSVCLASYNGERYLEQQLDSILQQVRDGDEIIVSDDGSTDGTLALLRDYQENYDNIRVVKGPKDGFSSNFGNAIQYANNDIIVFSDQDDIWCNNKIDLIREAFSDPKVTTILHTMFTFRDNKLKDTSEISISYHSGVLRNFVKSCYWGCCMAVRREFVRRFLPFRKHCAGHDQLIGLMSEKYGKVVFLDQPLIWHRLHITNTSKPKTFKQMIDFRIELRKDYLFAINKYDKSDLMKR